MKRVLQKIIDLYSILVSPIFQAMGTRCRFHPSCSEYAREALETRPFLEAARLIVWRLLRCSPLCEGGIDHVPQTER